MTTAVVRVKALYRLSRGTLTVLNVAQPLIGGLLADSQPEPGRIALLIVGGLTAFFAVYAVNDLVDARIDRQRGIDPVADERRVVDGAGGRHPLARGVLSFRLGLAWALVLSAVTVVVLAFLSWVCVALFVVAALLETAYCLLARISMYKYFLSGIMVALGAVAGWLAISATIDPIRLGLLVVWLGAWEIGGRNFTNDLADIEGDTRLGIKTVPTVRGTAYTARLSFAYLMVAAIASCLLAFVAMPLFGMVGLVGTIVATWLTLLRPGITLLRRPGLNTALSMFNAASLQPVCVLVSFVAGLAFESL